MAGGVLVFLIAIILCVKYWPQPPPQKLQAMTTGYLKAISEGRIYEAYKMESIAGKGRGKLPLAPYEAAVRKHYNCERQPLYKTINTGAPLITGNNAVVPFKVDVQYQDTGRMELLEGEFEFRQYADGWRKEPDEFLQKALEEYTRLIEDSPK
ncbi:MAG TPA: hypothetical protein ENN09_03945 [Planctomycetes bacterium]|nr:hypothetical protein [Planctomycetota bacterium]